MSGMACMASILGWNPVQVHLRDNTFRTVEVISSETTVFEVLQDLWLLAWYGLQANNFQQLTTSTPVGSGAVFYGAAVRGEQERRAATTRQRCTGKKEDNYPGHERRTRTTSTGRNEAGDALLYRHLVAAVESTSPNRRGYSQQGEERHQTTAPPPARGGFGNISAYPSSSYQQKPFFRHDDEIYQALETLEARERYLERQYRAFLLRLGGLLVKQREQLEYGHACEQVEKYDNAGRKVQQRHLLVPPGPDHDDAQEDKEESNLLASLLAPSTNSLTSPFTFSRIKEAVGVAAASGDEELQGDRARTVRLFLVAPTFLEERATERELLLSERPLEILKAGGATLKISVRDRAACEKDASRAQRFQYVPDEPFSLLDEETLEDISPGNNQLPQLVSEQRELVRQKGLALQQQAVAGSVAVAADTTGPGLDQNRKEGAHQRAGAAQTTVDLLLPDGQEPVTGRLLSETSEGQSGTSPSSGKNGAANSPTSAAFATTTRSAGGATTTSKTSAPSGGSPALRNATAQSIAAPQQPPRGADLKERTRTRNRGAKAATSPQSQPLQHHLLSSGSGSGSQAAATSAKKGLSEDSNMTSQILRTGLLEKKSRKTEAWKWREFVLTAEVLSYRRAGGGAGGARKQKDLHLSEFLRVESGGSGSGGPQEPQPSAGRASGAAALLSGLLGGGGTSSTSSSTAGGVSGGGGVSSSSGAGAIRTSSGGATVSLHQEQQQQTRATPSSPSSVFFIRGKQRSYTLRARSSVDREGWILSVAKQAALVKELELAVQAEVCIADLQKGAWKQHEAGIRRALSSYRGCCDFSAHTRNLFVDYCLELAGRNAGFTATQPQLEQQERPPTGLSRTRMGSHVMASRTETESDDGSSIALERWLTSTAFPHFSREPVMRKRLESLVVATMMDTDQENAH